MASTKNGQFHYKTPQSYNNKPVVIFQHGGSPRSQHTEFWTPILEIITNHCYPVLIDRFGHGKSEKRSGMEANDEASYQVMTDVLKDTQQEKAYIVGRSAGGWVAMQHLGLYPDKIAGLGLIAPAGMKDGLKILEQYQPKLTVLWDTDDPVVSFSNYTMLNNSTVAHQLFTIGNSPDATESISHEGIKASHVPELMAPQLFEKFLLNLLSS